jgi:hypothetical protein
VIENWRNVIEAAQGCVTPNAELFFFIALTDAAELKTLSQQH